MLSALYRGADERAEKRKGKRPKSYDYSQRFRNDWTTSRHQSKNQTCLLHCRRVAWWLATGVGGWWFVNLAAGCRRSALVGDWWLVFGVVSWWFIMIVNDRTGEAEKALQQHFALPASQQWRPSTTSRQGSRQSHGSSFRLDHVLHDCSVSFSMSRTQLRRHAVVITTNCGKLSEGTQN